MDVVVITPEPGRVKEIGQRLLALAEGPYDVHWVTWPAPGGFSVPLELFNKFDTDELATGGLVKSLPHIGEDGPPALEVPTRRRRRAAKESTDNNTSEEE